MSSVDPTHRRRIAVVGSTASGKSALAMRLARESSGELLCVDSMTVYRGMDIGTAKADAVDREVIPHHGLDLVAPDKEFSVAEFQRYAVGVLDRLDELGMPAVLVGGTGLYVDAVVNGFTMPGQFPDVRHALDGDLAEHGLPSLYARLQICDPVAASRMEPTNERRVVRALEVCVGSGRPFSSFGPGLQETRAAGADVALVAIEWARPELRRRIEERFAAQLDAGFVNEVQCLLDRYGDRIAKTAGQALGYRELWAHLRGETSLDEAVDAAITRTRQFAVRQERWFKRDARIRWLTPDEAATITADEFAPQD
jgi:tRNA dimethylallyltransferase